MMQWQRFCTVRYVVIVFLLAALMGCGSDASSSSKVANDTGAVALRLRFGTSADPGSSAMSPRTAQSPTICQDYQIFYISIRVMRALDDTPVVADGQPCLIGSLTIGNVPAGETLYVVCEGFVGSNPDPLWQGKSDQFTVNPGQTRNIGSVSMTYQGGDTNHPYVKSTIPGNSDNVPLNVAITVVFNEKLASSTVNSAAITVKRADDGAVVAGDVTYEELSADGYQLRFISYENLEANTKYVYALGNELTDTAALSLQGQKSWEFTTGEATNQPPVARIVAPVEGDDIVLGDPIIFSGIGVDSEDMDLSGENLVWTSNRDGYLGHDDYLEVAGLTAGDHFITLTTVDSAGARASDTIKISVSGSSPIPDTGQTTSYTATFGEDADYTINPRSYAKLDTGGRALDDSATDWAMVKDNVTGLIWERKTDDSGVHDRDNLYTWPQAQDVFIAQLNLDRFGGYSDWRLPDVKELSYLIFADGFAPAVDRAYFPSMTASLYWSASHITLVDSSETWPLVVDFEGGSVLPDNSIPSKPVRAVRGERQKGQFMIDDETVLDTRTGLMWQRFSLPAGTMTWEEALSYCEGLVLAGYTDWRMPNRNELQSIVDYDAYSDNTSAAIPAVIFIDAAAFPELQNNDNPDFVDFFYWTSTTDPGRTGAAWSVLFDYSGLLGWSEKTFAHNVRAVRGGNQNSSP